LHAVAGYVPAGGARNAVLTKWAPSLSRDGAFFSSNYLVLPPFTGGRAATRWRFPIK
jgi:hypothetical protein